MDKPDIMLLMTDEINWLGGLHITEELEVRYLAANKKYNLTDFINRKVFRASDTPLTYRQINTLDKDDLLGEPREAERTWREFSAKEMTYLLIVEELKRFGFEHNKLYGLWRSFFGKTAVDPLRGDARPNHYLGETAVGCALGGIEIIVTINHDGGVNFYDPSSFAAHDHFLNSMPSAYLKLSLNEYVNRTFERMKLKPIAVHWSVSEEYIKSRVLALTPKELRILDIIRNEDYQSIRLTKRDGEVKVVHAEKQENGVVSRELITNLLKKGAYQDITITQRDGNIVNVKQDETFKL